MAIAFLRRKTFKKSRMENSSSLVVLLSNTAIGAESGPVPSDVS
jgi:hypothetical protein